MYVQVSTTEVVVAPLDERTNAPSGPALTMRTLERRPTGSRPDELAPEVGVSFTSGEFSENRLILLCVRLVAVSAPLVGL
jgi:hypothetical protein